MDSEVARELRRLRREDPEAFREFMRLLKQKIEADGLEITLELLYEN